MENMLVVIPVGADKVPSDAFDQLAATLCRVGGAFTSTERLAQRLSGEGFDIPLVLLEPRQPVHASMHQQCEQQGVAWIELEVSHKLRDEFTRALTVKG